MGPAQQATCVSCAHARVMDCNPVILHSSSSSNSSSSSSMERAAPPLPAGAGAADAATVAPVTEEERQRVAVLAAAARGGLFDTANSQNGQSELGTYDHWQGEYARDLERFTRQKKNKQRRHQASPSSEHDSARESSGGGDGDDDDDDDDDASDEDEDIDGSDDSDGGAGDSGKRAMGQIWYGRHVASRQAELVAPFCAPGATVIDIGAGNGELLCRLASMRYHEQGSGGGGSGGSGSGGGGGSGGAWAHLVGTDYCPEAVLLGRAVAQAQAAQHPACARIEFLADDIFNSALPAGCADVLLDKGTLDALSCLFDDRRGTARVLAYGRALARLGRVGSTVLCVTSGNFSLEELHDVLGYAGWRPLDHVRDYPTFQFMGVTGTHVRTVLYRLDEDPEAAAAEAVAVAKGEEVPPAAEREKLAECGSGDASGGAVAE